MNKVVISMLYFLSYTTEALFIRMAKKKEWFIIFIFTAWPDKSVPKYASSLVHFRHKVATAVVKDNGPDIVHCRFVPLVGPHEKYIRPHNRFNKKSNEIYRDKPGSLIIYDDLDPV